MSKVQTPGPTVLLTRLARTVYRYATPELMGLRLKDYAALRQLRDEGDMSQAALCSAVHVDANHMVLMLNDLEASGYVTRRRDPADRRRHIVELTDEGMAAIEAAEQAMDDIEDEILGPLNAEERDTLRELLDRAMRSQRRPTPARS